jgi:hypothetical protein
MPQKRKPPKRRAKKAPAREYREPRTVAELGINCALCGAPGAWFDHQRGRNDTRQGVLCESCPRSPNSEKLLVRGAAAITGAL